MTILNDIRAKEYTPDRGRVLIHGQPGTGKTTLAATIAMTIPTLFLYVPGEEGINSTVGLEWEDNLTRHRLTSIEELWEIYWDFQRGEDHGYGAIAIDSVSALQVMWKKHLLGQPMDEPYLGDAPELGFSFWGSLRDDFTDFFTHFYALAASSAKRPVHVVMTSQTATLEDAAGDSKMQPDLHKGPLSAAVSRADYILYTHMTPTPDLQGQKHAVRLKPSMGVTAKTRGQAGQLPAVTDKITLPGYLKLLGASGL